MHFKTLTWVPIDMDAIDLKSLTETQKLQLFAYQSRVCEKLSPYLTEQEAAWLKKETEVPGCIGLGRA